MKSSTLNYNNFANTPADRCDEEKHISVTSLGWREADRYDEPGARRARGEEEKQIAVWSLWTWQPDRARSNEGMQIAVTSLERWGEADRSAWEPGNQLAVRRSHEAGAEEKRGS